MPIGNQSATYEFVRYKSIVHYIDRSSIGKNRSNISCEPHFFPRRDNALLGGSTMFQTLNLHTITGISVSNGGHSPRSNRKILKKCTDTLINPTSTIVSKK